MPRYQYRCTACAQDLEVAQSINDPALTDCVSCGGQLRRVFGSVGVVFKGSGFYKTDSRSGPKSSSSRKETTPASSSAEASSAETSAASSVAEAGPGSSAPAASAAKESSSSSTAAA